MKRVLSLLSLVSVVLAYSGAASAGEPAIPNCWVSTPAAPLQVGAYIVGLDSRLATKEQVVAFLDQFRNGAVEAKAFPLIFRADIFVLAETRGLDDPRADLTALRAQAETMLRQVATRFPGVSIDCDYIRRPANPGVSIGN